jgi:hypothetical protein
MRITDDFATIHNYYERPVMQAISDATARYPHMKQELLPDVLCVALNRLPPRYIRHEVDLVFYLTEKERAEIERAVDEAVTFAFEFVQARAAMRARG